jgi:hypothetical protein
MPFSTGVRLPKAQVPLFPPLCVGCRFENPPAVVTLWSVASTWWAFFVPLLALFWSQVAKVRAPFCRSCAWRLRLRRLASAAIFIAVIAIAIYFTKGLFPKAHRLIQKVVSGAACLVGLLPFLIWHIVRPPAITVDPQGDDVVYEFRDWVYAHEFAELNQGEIVPE